MTMRCSSGPQPEQLWRLCCGLQVNGYIGGRQRGAQLGVGENRDQTDCVDRQIEDGQRPLRLPHY